MQNARPTRIFLLASLGLALLLQPACRSKTVNIKEDLLQYVEKVRVWALLEKPIKEAITKVRRDQFVHDDFVLDALKPAVDASHRYVQELENYHPLTQPLINVHKEYIEAWRTHALLLASIVAAIEKKDYVQLAKSNTDLFDAQQSGSATLEDLARLLKEAGIYKDPQRNQPSVPQEEGGGVSPSAFPRRQ